jgi:hypothetical protein
MQTWTFAGIHKSTTINALVSLSLDPATKDSDFIQVKYHKDQANSKDYSHEGQPTAAMLLDRVFHLNIDHLQVSALSSRSGKRITS